MADLREAFGTVGRESFQRDIEQKTNTHDTNTQKLIMQKLMHLYDTNGLGNWIRNYSATRGITQELRIPDDFIATILGV